MNYQILQRLKHINKITYAGYFFTCLAILIGLYARFKGLGTAPISGDEYHTAQSVRNILEHGLPKFDCGGFYFRSFLLQYILAAFSFIPGLTEETAYRMVTVFFNLAAMPALFLLARRIGGIPIALASLAFFSLSVWEIENARYIRMYAPFQTFFLWYVYFLYKITIEKRQQFYKHIWAISLTSILIYETGIFLCVLNFIPYFTKNNQAQLKSIATALAIMLIAILFILTDWRSFEAQPQLAKDVIQSIQTLPSPQTQLLPKNIGPLLLPKNILLSTIIQTNSNWIYAFLGLFVLSIAMLWKTRHMLLADIYLFIAVICTLFFTLLNQFGLAILTILLLWTTNLIHLRDINRKNRLILASYICISFLFWLSYCLLTKEWYGLFQENIDNPLFKYLVVAFKYPNIYTKVILQWLYGQPITTLIFLSAILLGFVIAILRNDINPKDKFLYSIVILVVTLTAILKQPYYASRYTFFIYPVIILLSLRGIQSASSFFGKQKNLYFIGITLITVIAAEDIDFNHIKTIDTPKTIYRLNYEQQKSKHLWDRLDVLSPSMYVNKHIKTNDLVLSTVRPAHYYLDQLDFYYKNKHNIEFRVSSACESKKEIWTNADLIYTEDELLSRLSIRKQNIWLITHNKNTRLSNTIEKKINFEYQDDLVFKGADNRISVFLLKKNVIPKVL